MSDLPKHLTTFSSHFNCDDDFHIIYLSTSLTRLQQNITIYHVVVIIFNLFETTKMKIQFNVYQISIKIRTVIYFKVVTYLVDTVQSNKIKR